MNSNSRLNQPHDRSSFFKSMGTLFAGLMAEKIEEALESLGPKLLRPPGALNELAFLTECTRCDECIRACPQGTLKRAPASTGLASGTPHFTPREMPCFLCESLPCIAACPEKALELPRLKTDDGTQKEGPEAVRIGVAHVKSSRCRTFDTPTRQALRCRDCIDRCPYPGTALRLRIDEQSQFPHPEVIEDGCTGCGLCEFGCPEPLPGIVVRTRL